MGVNSISLGLPHVRPMGLHRTCGGPGEIKKHPHPRNVTARVRGQARTNLVWVVEGDMLVSAGVRATLMRDHLPRMLDQPGVAWPAGTIGNSFKWVRLLASSGSPHVLRAHMRHTCGEPNEIELTAAHGVFYRCLSGWSRCLRT